MINEEKLMAEGTILYRVCEIWENTHSLPFAPYCASFTNDVDTFLLTFSDDPIGILEKMTWFPGTFASSETVLDIYKELAELQESLTTEDYIPDIIRYSKSHRDLPEQTFSRFSDHTEHFYDFFDQLGHWILEQNKSDKGRKEKLETTLDIIRNFIQE